MAQMFPDEDDRKRAQDSIDNRLRNYGKNLWVPDREEYLAMREKEDAKKSKQGIAADTIPERTIVEAESVSEEKPSSAARAKKRATKKRSSTKKPKVSSSSSSNSGQQNQSDGARNNLAMRHAPLRLMPCNDRAISSLSSPSTKDFCRPTYH